MAFMNLARGDESRPAVARRVGSRSALKRMHVLLALLGASLSPSLSHAFAHTVRAGETLAAIASRYYGTPQMERVLVTANGLDRSGPKSLTEGMLLEIPEPRFHRVEPGETWDTLANNLLGHSKRATTLASANHSEPWVPPETGRVIVVPYNLSWVLSGEESLQTLAYRFMGSNKFAWELMQYNLLTKPELPAGRVLLIPLKALSLSPEGQAAARAEKARLQVALAEDQKSQQDASTALTELRAEVRSGFYVQALRRATALRSRGGLSRPQSAQLAVMELELLVAFNATGAAKEACETLHAEAPDFHFDPAQTSPKIIRVCPDVQAALPVPNLPSDRKPGSAPATNN